MEMTLVDFQKYRNPNVRPASDEVQQAIADSPLDGRLFLKIEDARQMAAAGYAEVENGYAFHPDGSATVSVLTDMPDVTPDMWHWWFGWHGDSDEKYKLWHPPAHIGARWGDGEIGRVGYIGRDSHIQEYLGPSLEKGVIQFKSPTIVGLPEFDPETSDAVYIVARIGLPIPIDFGWLIHEVRRTENGSEMRSRFWMGGNHIAARSAWTGWLVPIARRFRKIPESLVSDLLEHCAEEMSHLATFLPDLYADLNQD
ncbi:MAG: hypothetical protein AAF902_11890 [Chloroflexota bacterium]